MMTPIALITGGSRGLGRSMVLNLARKGVDVVFTYREREAEAAALVQAVNDLGQQAAALQLDVAKGSGFEAFATQLQQTLDQQWQRCRFNYLVNNAGVGVHKTFEETTEDEFDQLMNIHLKAPFFLTQQLVPLLEDGGAILNVSSGLTRFAIPGYAAYATMKGGIEVLTHYLAKELGERGIRVNTLAPGAIETDFGGGAVRDNQELNQFLASQTALGRVGVPEDIGPVVAYLLQDENRWVTAQRIEASGGMFL
ncbi:MAG: SDR family oxidoreductase [Saccharospirillum sp.]|uniref:SDR family NAD(P)-dependent oxidoreductase n=1 Tax=Saccharospirillum sp. TaxID=2033801 RepID=UPI00329938CD